MLPLPLYIDCGQVFRSSSPKVASASPNRPVICLRYIPSINYMTLWRSSLIVSKSFGRERCLFPYSGWWVYTVRCIYHWQRCNGIHGLGRCAILYVYRTSPYMQLGSAPAGPVHTVIHGCTAGRNTWPLGTFADTVTVHDNRFTGYLYLCMVKSRQH